jgi:hypothetical protein
MDYAKHAILNVTDALTLAPTVLIAPQDTTNADLFVSKLVIPTNTLMIQPGLALLATLNVKLVQANNSVPLVPILKPFQSMVSVTIAHILAIHVDQLHPSAQLALRDSTLLDQLALLPAQQEQFQSTESANAIMDSFTLTNVFLAAQLDSEPLVVNALNALLTALDVQDLRTHAQVA